MDYRYVFPALIIALSIAIGADFDMPKREGLVAVASAPKPSLVSGAPKNCTEAKRQAYWKKRGDVITSISTGKAGALDSCYGSVLAPMKQPSADPDDYVCTGRSGVVEVTSVRAKAVTQPNLYVDIGECSLITVSKLPEEPDKLSSLLEDMLPVYDETTGKWTNRNYSERDLSVPLLRGAPSLDESQTIYDDQGNLLRYEIAPKNHAMLEYQTPPSQDNIFDGFEGQPTPGPIPEEFQPAPGESFVIGPSGDLVRENTRLRDLARSYTTLEDFGGVPQPGLDPSRYVPYQTDTFEGSSYEDGYDRDEDYMSEKSAADKFTGRVTGTMRQAYNAVSNWTQDLIARIAGWLNSPPPAPQGPVEIMGIRG